MTSAIQKLKLKAMNKILKGENPVNILRNLRTDLEPVAASRVSAARRGMLTRRALKPKGKFVHKEILKTNKKRTPVGARMKIFLNRHKSNLTSNRIQQIINHSRRIQSNHLGPFLLNHSRRIKTLGPAKNEYADEKIVSSFEALLNPPWNLSNDNVYHMEVLGRIDKSVNPTNMQHLSTVIASGALPKLKHLRLPSNQIGNDGIIAFAKAITPITGRGALPNLTILNLQENGITWVGMIAFANACASGALTNLIKFSIASNNIGNGGTIALAIAIKPVNKNRIGAFPRLKNLDLSDNGIGETGMIAFANACKSRALPELTLLSIDGNKISDVGLIALASACANMALPKLKSLYVDRMKNLYENSSIRVILPSRNNSHTQHHQKHH